MYISGCFEEGMKKEFGWDILYLKMEFGWMKKRKKNF